MAKIQSQIKQTEQQHKQIEKKLETSAKDIEKTKKQLVKTADRVSDLEEQRAILTKNIADLDKQRDKITKDLSANYDGIADTAAGMLFIAANPNFDTKTMHDYVLTSVVLNSVANEFDSKIMYATQQLEKLDQIREQRASEKEKLDRSAKKYSAEKDELDKLLKTRSAQNDKLKTQQAVVQDKLKKLSNAAKNISELSAGVGSSRMSNDTKLSK